MMKRSFRACLLFTILALARAAGRSGLDHRARQQHHRRLHRQLGRGERNADGLRALRGDEFRIFRPDPRLQRYRTQQSTVQELTRAKELVPPEQKPALDYELDAARYELTKKQTAPKSSASTD